MAVNPRHKIARHFRDFLIESDSMKMFKEEEMQEAIIFRSIYTLQQDKRVQFMIIMNDSVYISMQSLLFTGVPTEKREKVLDVINQVHILYPTMKFVLSPEGNIMTSMIFHGNENNVDGKMILMCTLEFFKAFDANVYKRFAEILEN
jgi:hypothetical protein